MSSRHHPVTITSGKSLVKTNQRTINALIAFLVWIVFFHSTSYYAFVLGAQASQSPKIPSKTILLTNNNPAITTSSFLQLPDNSPAITTSSFLQLPNDSPAKQCPVPNNDSPAKQCPVPKNYDSSFKQLSVPQVLLDSFLTRSLYLDTLHPSVLLFDPLPQRQDKEKWELEVGSMKLQHP
jgi:hypothetical protein